MTTLPTDADTAGLGMSMLWMLVFGSLVTVVSLAVVGGYVRLYRAGEADDASVGVLWEEAKGLLLPLTGLMALGMAVYLLSVVVMAVPCLGALAWLGFWLWALPYVTTTYAVRVVEVDTLGEAFRRAQMLVKGSWGFAAGAMILAVIVAFVLAIGLSIPLYIVGMMVGMNTVADDPTGLFNVIAALMAPYQVLTVTSYIVPYLAAFFVHGRLVEELEGTSLHDDLDALVGSVPAERRRDALASTPPVAPPPSSMEEVSDDAPASTREAADDAPPPDDAPRGGFRGGGFGDGDA